MVVPIRIRVIERRLALLRLIELRTVRQSAGIAIHAVVWWVLVVAPHLVGREHFGRRRCVTSECRAPVDEECIKQRTDTAVCCVARAGGGVLLFLLLVVVRVRDGERDRVCVVVVRRGAVGGCVLVRCCECAKSARGEAEACLAQTTAEGAYLAGLAVGGCLEGGVDSEKGAGGDLEVCDLSIE